MLAPHFSPAVGEMWRLKWGYSEDGKEKCTYFFHSGHAVIAFPYLLISWLYHKHILFSVPRGKGTPNISREPWGHEAINSAATGPVRAEEEAQGKLQPFSTIHQIYSRKSEEHFVTFLNQAVFRNTELNLPMQTAIWEKNRCLRGKCHKNPKVVLWRGLVIEM